MNRPRAAGASLRTRLLIGVVAVSLVGLAAAGLATTALVRSALLSRTDERLGGLAESAQRRLVTRGTVAPDSDQAETNRFGRASGYYAQIDDAAGQPIDRTEPAPAGTQLPVPDLPTISLSSGATVPDDAFTVGSVGDAGFEWRVRALPVTAGNQVLLVALPLTEVHDTIRTLLVIELLTALTVLAGIAALGHWVVRVGLRPLRDIEVTAEAIAAGDLSRRVEPAGARTEIGRLGASLNTMLGTIEESVDEREASEARLRQFVADASHELRTPVSAIRGYAELYEQGVISGDDLDRAMHRIKGESIRMTVLITDLLALARLDEGGSATFEEIDLADLVADAVSDARAIEPERPIELVVGTQPTVRADRHQLHQVVANLLANVRDHTPPAAPARVEVGGSGGRAVVTVTDSGPGIPPELGEKVFERFRRADAARTRVHGGAGLGLAIVAAIVELLGGTVTVADATGGGAAFTITLPVSVAVPPAASAPPPTPTFASASGSAP